MLYQDAFNIQIVDYNSRKMSFHKQASMYITTSTFYTFETQRAFCTAVQTINNVKKNIAGGDCRVSQTDVSKERAYQPSEIIARSLAAAKPRRLPNRSAFNHYVSRERNSRRRLPRKQKCWETRLRAVRAISLRVGRDDIRAPPFFSRPSDSRSSNRNFIRAPARIQLRLHYLEC